MSTTTVPVPTPSPTEDCEQLRKAVEGWGTDENLVIQILGHRTAAQRKLIKQTYFELYGEDLLKRLESELSSEFEGAVFLWVLDPAERDAVLAHEAIRKWNPKNKSLLEISCARTSSELLMVRQAYHIRYKKSLEEDIAAHTIGDFRKLLVALVSSYRYEGPEVDMRVARSEAKQLHEAITNKVANHEEVIRIMSTRSKPHLNATFNHYRDEYGHHINKALKSESPDDFQDALRIVIKCICSPEMHFTKHQEIMQRQREVPPHLFKLVVDFQDALEIVIRSICHPDMHFAKVLRLSMEKLGTDENALTRVVVTRAEVDMKYIKQNYFKRTSKKLAHAIAADTSGDYQDFLLTLIGKDDA